MESKISFIRYTQYVGPPGIEFLIKICLQLSKKGIKIPKLNQKWIKMNQKAQKLAS
jgi:hypothetical protein